MKNHILNQKKMGMRWIMKSDVHVPKVLQIKCGNWIQQAK